MAEPSAPLDLILPGIWNLKNNEAQNRKGPRPCSCKGTRTRGLFPHQNKSFVGLTIRPCPYCTTSRGLRQVLIFSFDRRTNYQKRSCPADMCGWTGHIQGNLTERVCEPPCGECAVRRQILSPGTAKLRRVLRTKQPKRSRGSGLPFASPLRRAQQKQGNRNHQGGRNFCRAAARRNWSTLKRVKRHAQTPCESRALVWVWFLRLVTRCRPARRGRTGSSPPRWRSWPHTSGCPWRRPGHRGCGLPSAYCPDTSA